MFEEITAKPGTGGDIETESTGDAMNLSGVAGGPRIKSLSRIAVEGDEPVIESLGRQAFDELMRSRNRFVGRLRFEEVTDAGHAELPAGERESMPGHVSGLSSWALIS